jgi:TRAP-type C4-dicarboxylate transport system permease small subunit
VKPRRPPRSQQAVLALAVGAAMILGSWIAVSGRAAFADQVAWINVGVAGLVVVAAGVSAYLVEFRREIRRRLALAREVQAR